ncbi:MAG TPA: hypothetical protein VFM06_03525 [Candidatus Limnocylindria bacterium]|nr:hypothetical protein [Candidatus Limnocylindria bacterium]
MKLAWLLVANAAVSGLFGLVAAVFPGPLFDAFGGTSDVGSQFVVQLFGAALIGEALLRLSLRDIAPGATRTALASACFVEYVIALYAAIAAQTSGVTNAGGYVLIAITGAFALGYGYVRFAGVRTA